MMARSPAVALDSAYFPNEDVSTSFDLPPVTPSRNRRLLDDTLPLAGHDVSDASFQIPIAANASNLMTDDDFLQRNPDVCATPYVPLTLSQLTPSAKHFARDLEEEASTPTATPRRHATPKFKPRPTPHRQHGTPTSAAFIPMQNSPGRQRRVPSKATPTPPTADMPDESGIDRLAMMKQEVENLMKSTEPSESAVVLPKPLVPASTARPKSLRAKSAAPTAGVSKLKKPVRDDYLPYSRAISNRSHDLFPALKVESSAQEASVRHEPPFSYTKHPKSHHRQRWDEHGRRDRDCRHKARGSF